MPNERPLPSQRDDLGDLGAGRTSVQLVDEQEPLHDQADGQRHDQRVDPEDAHADAVDEARPARAGTGRSGMARTGPCRRPAWP